MILIPVDMSDLEEAALPLEKYASLREFFVRTLKEGSRPINDDPQCLVTGNSYLEFSKSFHLYHFQLIHNLFDHIYFLQVSPVDGTVLRFGELKGAGAMIEQVKGFSYSIFSLLGASPFLPTTADSEVQEEHSESMTTTAKSKKSWWKVSLASPKVWDPTSSW